MNRIEPIMNRRSIRKFADRPVEREKLESILRAAMQAPTAKNSQCWRFLVVQNPEALAAVSTMSPYSMCAKNAKALIVTLVDRRIEGFALGIWIQDLAAANQNMLTQIEAEGLGATWLGMYPFQERIDALTSYFRLPEEVLPFSVIALGYKLREKAPEDRFDPSKIHWEVY